MDVQFVTLEARYHRVLNSKFSIIEQDNRGLTTDVIGEFFG